MNTETDAQQPGRKWSCLRLAGKLVLLVLVLVFLGAAALGVGAYLAYEHVTRPGTPGETVAVTIPEGLSGKAVGKVLADRGLVEHELFFRLAMR
ncbi:MAG TPA: hypothetical protein PK166_17010, partial [Candidatus Hydrogenedentes bacterium]|nr:hypothetical protein [Candidatus Hydrogenedentota bacterium]